MSAKTPQETPPELLAVTRAYDLVREISTWVAKYPWSHRFVLGDRTLATAYDVLDQLVDAKSTRDKLALLNRACVLLSPVTLIHGQEVTLAYGAGRLTA